MKLGMEVGIGRGHIVLDENQLLSVKGGQPPPNFQPMSIVAKWLDGPDAIW